MIITKTYTNSHVNVKEVLRYAGANKATNEVLKMVEDCLTEAVNCFTYKVCYGEFPITKNGVNLDLGFLKTNSKDLIKNLDGCDSVVLFAATVGTDIDRLISKYSRISPAKALIFQALGAERIENLCDRFNKEITDIKISENKFTKPRFSAGYGDFPLNMQKDILGVLNCSKNIGVTLNDSLTMSPTKSVTAIIGVGSEKSGD